MRPMVGSTGLFVGCLLAVAVRASAASPALAVVQFKDGVARHSVCEVRHSPVKHFLFVGLLHVDSDGAPQSYAPGFSCTPEDGVGWKGRTFNCAHLHKQATCKRHAPGCQWEGGHCKGTIPGQCTHTPNGDARALDYLANAGEPGNFYGLMKDPHAAKHNGDEPAPCVQGAGDPAPGFYVSGSALVGPARSACDPGAYVDSTAIAYVALPSGAAALGVHKGDLVAVGSWKTGKVAFAIFADSGGKPNGMGEGSVALATALGAPANPKGSRGPDAQAAYLVFPGSATRLGLAPRVTEWPVEQQRIDEEGRKLLDAWGGEARFRALSEKLPRDNPAHAAAHPCG